MTASRYVAIVEQQLHTLLGLDADGGLLIVAERPLPLEARQALAGYAPQLIQYFQTGVDRELHVGRMKDEWESLGFIYIEDAGAFSHLDGDDAGDRILAGVVPAATARAETQARRKQWQIIAQRPWSLSS